MEIPKVTSYFLMLIFCLIFSYSHSCLAITETQFNDYKNASETIGKWLMKSSSHYDFLSATPIHHKRGGDRFMITEKPATQFASDYGFSVTRASLDAKVIAAYEVFGTPAASLPHYLELNRLHIGFGFPNKDDLSVSYMATQDMSLTGWGVGYKQVIFSKGPFFFSYRIRYSQSSREKYFDQKNVINDLSCSLYFLYFDVYGGIRHTMGIINFAAPDPLLTLPKIKYVSKMDELEYFYGIAVTLSTRLRLTVETNKIGDDFSIGAKVSFHFNSLFPELGSVTRDPRYLNR